MTLPSILAVGLSLAVLAWCVLTFNSFVRLRNRMREAFSGVDVQLRRRHDLVPNLVRVVAGYASHERGTLEEVTRARQGAASAADRRERERGENELARSLDRLFVVAEAYPELRADRGFSELQRELVDVEEQIQYSRRYYNGAVRDYNNRIQQFPANVLARLAAMSPAGFFEIESPAERNAPAVVVERT